MAVEDLKENEILEDIAQLTRIANPQLSVIPTNPIEAWRFNANQALGKLNNIEQWESSTEMKVMRRWDRIAKDLGNDHCNNVEH